MRYRNHVLCILFLPFRVHAIPEEETKHCLVDARRSARASSFSTRTVNKDAHSACRVRMSFAVPWLICAGGHMRSAETTMDRKFHQRSHTKISIVKWSPCRAGTDIEQIKIESRYSTIVLLSMIFKVL